ncbi:hypothetical protein [Actinomadura rudentiformis]|uniref:Uncharacterized protein n=1 Tax=Actinomadura rudentiformis TaxID=359158 RepID=A0A6H9YU61_9ACTN|nr:hypothetical protein [Actinomadura rudentiformis]KAB2344828.1 hypothetical protein F8566_30010 [Actinomadura rudentiformis]
MSVEDLCGTERGYRYGCRCRPCTDAHRQLIAEQKADRLARAAADPSIVPHGTTSGYINWDCRCDPCTDAYSQSRGKRPTKVKPTNRRWTPREAELVMQDVPLQALAEALGRTYNAVLTKRYLQRRGADSSKAVPS